LVLIYTRLEEVGGINYPHLSNSPLHVISTVLIVAALLN